MVLAVKQTGKALRRVMPARNEPSEKTYRGRVSRLWFSLRAGRDVDAIVKSIKRHGFDRVSKATYYNWEAGTTDPPIDALPAIAKALGVHVTDLFPAK